MSAPLRSEVTREPDRPSYRRPTLRPVVDSDAPAEALRCEECGGLTRCSGDPHRYYNAADMARPPVTVSPLWRDPLLNTNTTTKETTK